MGKLKGSFRKNGIDYKLLQRNEIVVMYELTIDNVVVGYEVSRIYINDERIIAGVIIKSGVGITGNEQFGKDGAKSFFPDDLKRAEKYFEQLAEAVAVKENMKNAKIALPVMI